MRSSRTPEYLAAARASVRRIRPLIVWTSGLSTCPGALLRMNACTSAASRSASSAAMSIAPQNSCTKSACRSASSSKTAMLPLVWYAVWTSCPWSQRRMNVPPIEITSSSGCGLNTSTRFGKTSSPLPASTPFPTTNFGRPGLPAGHPVIVRWRLLKTAMLVSYAPPFALSRPCRPFSL